MSMVAANSCAVFIDGVTIRRGPSGNEDPGAVPAELVRDAPANALRRTGYDCNLVF